MTADNPTRPDFTNRLANEKSPYLLQHAHNPVDWYPWGDEAIERARQEDKPIFLSVGYSTCHWCHVMEHESFEDEDVAAVMNEHFVNVKVDREEHPDVDQIYMTAVQRLTGQGGWPMSVFMTPELKPFFAGTYFPPTSRYGRPGFRDILLQISTAWTKQRASILEHVETIMDSLVPTPSAAADALPTRAAIDGAVAHLSQSFDRHYGGFGGAPKFPRSMTLMLLLRDRLASEEDADAKLGMVEKTLEMMWRGGLYDHVGGGFTRYSTDEEWLVPHFEKMLYDNALLVLAYVEAWQVTGNDDHRVVVTETLDFILAEMTGEHGGFFSALDADSEGEEGKFYVWTPKEIEDVLGAADAALFNDAYSVTERGNFEGKNIPNLRRSLDEIATERNMTKADLVERLRPLRRKLYAAREGRIRPGLDDKVLTSWNGLMIAAMARAGAVFDEPRFIDAADRAADFIHANLRDGDDLLRRYRDGDARLAGTLEDYSYLAFGLLELFQTTFDPSRLTWAETILERAQAAFEDVENGGYFLARENTDHLLVRMKEPYDGATPSGNSMMALSLAVLGEIRGDRKWRDLAEKTVRCFAGDLRRHPIAYPAMLAALDRLLVDPTEIAIFAGEDTGGMAAMLAKVRGSFLPHAVTVVANEKHLDALRGLVPWLENRDAVSGQATAYVCRGFTCERPVTRVDDLAI